jgi:DNA-binding transcriptional LysR family regulator
VNLIDLEAFVSVLDHGSIVAAAAGLHLTQSAVTRRIQNLEETLGVSLLDRETRPLQPTPAGQDTYEFARPVLNSVSDLRAAVMQNGEPSGDFRFGLPRGFGDKTLAAPIQNLHTEFPKLKLHAFVQWSGVLLERLANHKLDAAVVILPEDSLPPTSFAVEPVGTRRVSVIGAKSKRFDQPTTLEELSASPWVVNPTGCATRQLLEAALLQRRLPFETAVEAEGYELQFSLVSDGFGLGLAPPDILQASSRHKNIRIIKVKDFSPQERICLLYSKHIGRLAPAVRCLRDAVQQHFKPRA